MFFKTKNSSAKSLRIKKLMDNDILFMLEENVIIFNSIIFN